jgi:hypothetical protein
VSRLAAEGVCVQQRPSIFLQEPISLFSNDSPVGSGVYLDLRKMVAYRMIDISFRGLIDERRAVV